MVDMDKYDDCAMRIWNAINARIKALQADGQKQSAIAKRLGVSKGTITNWKKGDRSGANASFAVVLRYMDVLGLDIFEFLPCSSDVPGRDCEAKKDEIAVLKDALAEERLKTAKAEERAIAFREAFESSLTIGRNMPGKNESPGSQIAVNVG